MSKRLKKFPVMFVSAAMLAGTVPASACAVPAKATPQSSDVSSTIDFKDVIRNPLSVPELEITNDRPAISASFIKNAKVVNLLARNQASLAVKAMADTSSTTTTDTPTIYSLSASYFGNTTSLTSTSSQNYYTFSVSTARYMVLGLSSTNTSYYVQLYQYQSSSSSYAATNVIFTAGHTYTLASLPIGSYFLVVYSTGTVGDSYTIAMNASNPANPSNVFYSSFSNMVCDYSGNLYTNGTAILANNVENGTALDWRKSEDHSDGGYDEGLDQIIDLVHTDSSKSILHVTYSSKYASSNNALLIPIGSGTIWSFQHIYLDPKGIKSQTFTDIWGNQTPITLSAAILSVHPGYLVFDLATCKSIDFYSSLNYHYGYQGDTPTINVY